MRLLELDLDLAELFGEKIKWSERCRVLESIALEIYRWSDRTCALSHWPAKAAEVHEAIVSREHSSHVRQLVSKAVQSSPVSSKIAVRFLGKEFPSEKQLFNWKTFHSRELARRVLPSACDRRLVRFLLPLHRG